MSRSSKTGLAAQPSSADPPSASKRHFDTFETKFFEQGDEGEGHSADVDKFDDLDDPHLAGRARSSRQFWLGLAVGSVCVALLAGIGLWLVGSRSSRRAVTAGDGMPASSPTEAAPIVAVKPKSDPVSAPVVAPTAAVNAESVPVAQPAAAPSAVEPSAEPSGAPAPQAVPGNQPLALVPQPAQAPASNPAPAVPSDPPQPVALAEAPLAAAASDTVPGDVASGLRAECDKAMASRRGKKILAACPAAFDADPDATDIAVALAKAEFDRGHSASALAWGKKAIAVDPNAADAYVFIGGAEQSAGHTKAAIEAYRRYLQLAPGGRYAGDLRVIVRSGQ